VKDRHAYRTQQGANNEGAKFHQGVLIRYGLLTLASGTWFAKAFQILSKVA
jgi:hypothetical protein